MKELDYNAVLRLEERISKNNGEAFKVLNLYVIANNGYEVQIHQMYLTDSQKSVLDFIAEVNKTMPKS